MSLAPGTQLGPYEILAPAGAGGMGEVYRARDTRLGRTVAVKLLPPSFASDPDRLRRFEQEARAVAALEHPNILGLHDVGTHEGAPYLVTEFLEGESLRERLEAGALPARKISDYALQIARGLAAAHDKSIVHRDLKPENIYITRDGRVKLLDFGLAKLANLEAAAAAAGPEGATALPHESATAPGMIMGTVGYMSPEQVRGSAVDHRSDIFSFGAVLYEMASGSRAFKGETGVETMTAILKQDPAEFAPERAVPPGLERVIRRCLEKPPDQRFQSASDLAFAIEALSGTTTTSRELALQPARAWRPGMIAAALLLLAVGAAAGIAAWLALQPPPTGMHFSILPEAEPAHMALSPDGEMFAYIGTDPNTAKTQLYVQRVGAATATTVAGSNAATYPFWSPDSAYIAFFANGKLMKASMAGGVPQPLADAPSARGGSWSRKGVILYSPTAAGPLWRVNSDGSAASEVIPLGERQSTHRWAHFLPDGEHFLYYGGNFDDDPTDKISGIYAGTLESPERKLVVPARSNVFYAGSGHIFYMAGNKLVASEFDPSSGKAGTEQKLVVSEVGYQPQVYWGAFTVSQNGHVVTSRSMGSSLSQLTWYDRSGKQLGTVGERATQSNPMLSPRGDAVALDITDGATRNTDVWVLNLRSGSAARFSFGPDEETSGTWSPDGSQLIFRTSVLDARMLIRDVNGAAPPRAVILDRVTSNDDNLPMSWSRDGNTVLISLVKAGNGEIHAYNLAQKTHSAFIAGRADEGHPQFSPDNRWVAYTSDENGNREVYVTTYPQASGKWQVSRGGGTEPRWRGDGKELFYIGADGRLYAVPVGSSGAGFEVGVATPLFPVLARAAISATDIYNYTLTADGQRFLVNRYVPPTALAPFHLILNATSELEK